MTDKELIELSSDDFTLLMITRFPSAFQNIHRPPTETCMCWGFDIAPGWRPTLFNLCTKLSVLTELTGTEVVFDQIKEKYGAACFYHSVYTSDKSKNAMNARTLNDICFDLVAFHEQACDYIDDVTGEHCRPEEKIIITGWYYGCTAKGFHTHLKKKYFQNASLSKDEATKYYNREKTRLLMGKKRNGVRITEEDL